MFFISFEANKLFINHMVDLLDMLYTKTTTYLFRYKKNCVHTLECALFAKRNEPATAPKWWAKKSIWTTHITHTYVECSVRFSSTMGWSESGCHTCWNKQTDYKFIPDIEWMILLDELNAHESHDLVKKKSQVSNFFLHTKITEVHVGAQTVYIWTIKTWSFFILSWTTQDEIKQKRNDTSKNGYSLKQTIQ